MATIAAGLVLRLIPLGLPFAVTKWGGSALWAAMVYWLLTVLLPRRGALTLAAVGCAIAAVVELTRLYHTPGMDSFRLTLAGKLLLGRVFSLWDIAVYWAVILLVAVVDWRLLRPRL